MCVCEACPHTQLSRVRSTCLSSRCVSRRYGVGIPELHDLLSQHDLLVADPLHDGALVRCRALPCFWLRRRSSLSSSCHFKPGEKFARGASQLTKSEGVARNNSEFNGTFIRALSQASIELRASIYLVHEEFKFRKFNGIQLNSMNYSRNSASPDVTLKSWNSNSASIHL